jgi:hypothetical protein
MSIAQGAAYGISGIALDATRIQLELTARKEVPNDNALLALQDFAGYPLYLGAWYNHQKTSEVLLC